LGKKHLACGFSDRHDDCVLDYSLKALQVLLFEGGREMVHSIRRWALALSAALAGLNISK